MMREIAICKRPVFRTQRKPKRFVLPALRCAFSIYLVLLLAVASVADPTLAPRETRESAMNQAKSGNPRGALLVLKPLVEKYPDDPRLLGDTAIVANWAGDDAYALDLYSRAQTPKDDEGVVEAAARSARNLHRYETALALFERAEALAPDRWQARLGHAMVLTDEGQYTAATELMRPLLEKNRSEPDVARGEAYLCSRRGDYACAVGMYQQLLAQTPGDRSELQCQMAQALSQLGGNTLAQGLCNSSDSSSRLSLIAAKGAEQVRWSEAIDHDWPQRKSNGELALAALDGVISATQPSDPLWAQAQADRLLALDDLYRMQDVVLSWEQLQKSGVKVPDYATARVAAALLTLRRPNEAAKLFRDLLTRLPEDGNLWGGLANSQFESEHIQQAFQTIDEAYRNAPPWLQSPDLRVPQPNAFHLSLGTQAAEMRGSSNLYAEEGARLRKLLALAPASSEIGRAMAMNYMARGWPLLALRQERLADSFDQKEDLPVLQDAQVLEVAGRRKEADSVLKIVQSRDGISPSVNRFLTERAIERGWQATISSGYEWSNGRFLGNSQYSEAYFYSPFIGYRWRVYAHGIGNTGQFSTGSVFRARAAGGISYNYKRQSFWGEAAADPGSAGTIPAGAAGALFSLGDHWALGAEGDWDNIPDVQLIAQTTGVRARGGKVNTVWRQSELRSVRATVGKFLYSDGNQRSAVSGVWEQRILTQPRLQIDLSPAASASANSKDQNRVYFNPKHDVSLGMGAVVNWGTWRRYDRSLLQQFTVDGASYWQENYGVMAAVATSYTQQWKITRRLGLFARFVWNSHPYDGIREPYTDLKFGLTWGNQ